MQTNNDLAFGILLGIALISLILFFCLLLIRLQINKTKYYNQTIHQKDLDFQKSLNQTIIETQEQVLNNISQDLHDDAGQQLTYINFQLENLRLDSPELHTLLQPLSESVGGLSQSIRGISHALNNQLLLKQDLVMAIQTEVTRLQKNRKVKIHFTNEGPGKVFTANEKIIIYRIFQEITGNIFKHARATTVQISIQSAPQFRLTVTDNGKGFNVAEALGNSVTIGLQGIVSRAAIIGYTATIASEKGSGTTVTLSE